MDRRSGKIVGYAMLALSAIGALLAAGQPHTMNVLAGVLTFYMG